MNIFDIFQLVGSNIWLYGGAFVLVLSVLVFVHEWGHYIVARMCGVRVEVFSIGFGKELFGYTDKSNTRWKVSLIPLGGYVKLFGDSDPASMKHEEGKKDPKTKKIKPFTKAEKEVAFYNKPVWKRSAIVFAGPAINYIFAILILMGLYMFQGQPVTPPQAAAVIESSAAAKNGFEPHDTIISIDGKKINSFEDIRREMMIALDHEKHFVVERGGEEIDIYAAPERVEIEDRFGFKHSRGLLGLISPRNVVSIDDITRINGREYETLEQKRAVIQRNMGRKLTIETGRGDASDTLIVRPVPAMNEDLGAGDAEGSELLYLGSVESQRFVKLSPVESVFEAVEEAFVITRGTLEALGQMIVGSRSATELGGIIRIGALAGDMAQQGVIALVLFTALLSINLGLINLFPIPLLDGGHLVFYAVEAVLGKPVPERIQEYAFRAGLAFLVCLMAFANLNDIMQLIL